MIRKELLLKLKGDLLVFTYTFYGVIHHHLGGKYVVGEDSRSMSINIVVSALRSLHEKLLHICRGYAENHQG